MEDATTRAIDAEPSRPMPIADGYYVNLPTLLFYFILPTFVLPTFVLPTPLFYFILPTLLFVFFLPTIFANFVFYYFPGLFYAN
jgi:hypothetical protein